MKIVCDACQTKYSIADERVAGKVFKIRCKKCSQIIVVRGTAAEPVETPAPAGEWHVVIDGQQSGPFDRAELVRRHAAGEIDDESFVWRDGMDEWAAFASIAELAGEADRAPVAGAPSANAADAHEAMYSTRSADASTAAETPAEDKKLLAERNENSVLFTLGNLAKLASDSRPAKDAAPAKPGAAGGEGSGLIDIRALASTFAKPAAAKTSTAVGSLDDLPTFGPTTFGEPIVLMPSARPKSDRKMLYALFAALAMLAIMAAVLLVVVFRGGDPAHASKDGADRRVAALGTGDTRSDGTANESTGDSAAGSTASGSTGSTATGSTASGSTAGSTAAGSTASGTTASDSTASDSTASGSTASGSTASGPAASGSTASGSTVSGSSSTRPSTSSGTRPSTSSTRPSTSSSTRPSTSSSTSSSTRPSTSSTSTRPTTTPTTSSTAGKPDRIQCEFSGFTDKGCEIYKPATSTTATSNLPENLDRAAIAAGLGTIKAQGCGNKSSSRGDVSVQIKVNANGGVSGVTVKSSPDPALSSCVVAAAQRGTFAKTKRGASFGYVWRF